MSLSPSSQQSNPPDNNHYNQAIISSQKGVKEMSADEEEQQLLNENDGYIDGDNDEILTITKSKRRRYTSAPFIWFILSLSIGPLIIVILTFIMSDIDTPFSLVFVMGLITCIIGGCYFLPHLVLREELINVYELNQKKRFQTEKIHREIKSLNSAKNELSLTKKKIVNSNKETKKLLKNLQVMNIESVEELEESKGRAQKLYKEWHKQLLKKERILLHTLFDRFEFLDGSPGMDQNEFKQFIKALPDGYEERMNRLGTFQKLSKGNGIIGYQEFKSALDIFAEMEIDDKDIEFEVVKEESSSNISIIKKSTKARNIIKNKWFKNKSFDEK